MDQWNSILQRNKFKEGQYDPTEKVSSRGDWMKDFGKRSSWNTHLHVGTTLLVYSQTLDFGVELEPCKSIKKQPCGTKIECLLYNHI